VAFSLSSVHSSSNVFTVHKPRAYDSWPRRRSHRTVTVVSPRATSSPTIG